MEILAVDDNGTGTDRVPSVRLIVVLGNYSSGGGRRVV